MQWVDGRSARHHKTAVFGWLALVAVACVGGPAPGIKSVPYHDAGQSGRAEQTLTRLGVTAPIVEDVLTQARGPGRRFASYPQMRQAAQQVFAALDGLPGEALRITAATSGHAIAVSGLLSWLGPRADQGLIQFPGRRRTAARPSRARAALARRVVRRPVVWGGVAAIVLLALAAPAPDPCPRSSMWCGWPPSSSRPAKRPPRGSSALRC